MILSIEILGATQQDLKSLAEKLPSRGSLKIVPMKDGLMFWKWKGFQVEGAHDGLRDDLSAKAEYWGFRPEVNQELTELFDAFYKICPRRMYVYASEGGDLPKRETELDIDELKEVLSGGHLANRVKYLVRPATKPILPVEGETVEA